MQISDMTQGIIQTEDKNWELDIHFINVLNYHESNVNFGCDKNKANERNQLKTA